jgi:hypothetical protein
MNPQTTTPHAPRRNLTIAVLVSFLTLSIVGIASRAQDNTISNKDEREFKSTIPEHVPIKVKVKNEQSFRKMDNENWARELEIEVRNTGSKPIYYMALVVRMPEMVNDNGHSLTLAVHYGRYDLLYLDTQLQPGDVPILPGESTILKISERQVLGFEAMRPKEKVSNPKKVELVMQMINFGDGTGLRTKQGAPVSNPIRKQSSNDMRPRGPTNACLPWARVQEPTAAGQFINMAFSQEPASFLRVNFSPPFVPASVPVSSSQGIDSCGCQTVGDCFYSKLAPPNCPCDPDFIAEQPPASFPAFCIDPRGLCVVTETQRPVCQTEFNGEQVCTYQLEVGTCRAGNPAPTPTPPPCDEEERPNQTNCTCTEVTQGVWEWDCQCSYGFLPADHRDPANLGCPTDTFNNNDCCIPYASCAGKLGSQEAYELARQNCQDVQGGKPWRPYPDCDCGPPSPVLVDVAGDGLRLTSPASGVYFC